MLTKEEFTERVEKWSSKIGVDYKEIHFRHMKKKWASCSSSGRLTFDPDLLSEPLEFQDRSIIHELLHFRYPNHTKMFKIMLEAYISEGIE